MKIVILALLLGGCAISGREIEEAKSMCSVNGGIVYVAPGDILCSNGARFLEL